MKKFISVVVMLLLVNTICFAQIKTIKKESIQDVPSDKSLDQVVTTMTNDMIKQAVQEAGIKLNDYKLSATELAEFIKDIPQVEVKNKKVSMKKDNQQVVKMKLNIKIDTDSAKEYLDKIKQTNEAKAKAIDEKIQNIPSNPDTTTAGRLSIQKALEDSAKVKQEIAKICDNFENTLKEDSEEIARNYDGKISKINLNVKKDQWETTDQYNKKIEQQKLEKKKLEQEKQKAISENKKKIAQLAITTAQPQIDKLKSFQSGKFYDENDSKAQIISLGKVNADEKYFVIKILYDSEQSIISNLIYDFSDMDVEQAKSMYQTPKQFVIEPLFSVGEGIDGGVEKVLTAFNVKHLGTMKEKIVKISPTKLKQFSELRKIEVYENILNGKEPVVKAEKQEIKEVSVQEPVVKEESKEVNEQVSKDEKLVEDKIKEEVNEQKEVSKIQEEVKQTQEQVKQDEKVVEDKIKEEAKDQKEVAKQEVKQAQKQVKQEVKDQKQTVKKEVKEAKKEAKAEKKETKRGIRRN